MVTLDRYSDADMSENWFFMNSIQVLVCFLTLKFVGVLTMLLLLLVKLLFCIYVMQDLLRFTS